MVYRQAVILLYLFPPNQQVMAELEIQGAPEQVAELQRQARTVEKIEPSQTQLLPFAFARKFGVLLTVEQGRGLIRCRPDYQLAAFLEAQRHARLHGHLQTLSHRVIDAEEFERELAAVYALDASEARQMVADLDEEMNLKDLADNLPQIGDLLEQSDDAPIIRLINALLAEAVRENASDVHIEVYESDLVVRFRIDGVLREVVRPRRLLAPLLISRIKVMAKLDIAEKRLPQDGRISLRIAGREVDVRVSTLPTSGGERVVLRILDKQAGQLDLSSLGMSVATLEAVRDLVHRPHGVFLVTGPTGSGKTTTLYACMAELDIGGSNIMTIEDPVEYKLPGISQTQVNPKTNMDFSRGLRAILRQDPDIVMVGEIRDSETVAIAVQFSLTGHLVLSTLHTNTAVGAVTRLLDMGVPPFLLSSSMLGILAQRLVRRLCLQCRKQDVVNAREAEILGMEEGTRIFRAQGCDDCGQTGYRGRVGVYELVRVTEGMRAAIHGGASEVELEHMARELTPGIREDGRQKICVGLTSLEEVLRVSTEE